MKPRQILLVLAVAVVIAVVAISLYLNHAQNQLPQAAGAATPGPAVQTSDLMQAGPLGDMALGDAKAPNVVIEYASMTCSHCQRFNAEVFKPFKAKYIDTGKVYYIFRDFPLDPVATSASMIAHCAPPERFFAITDLLFEKQGDWAFVDDPKTALFNLTKQVGFTQESFDACLADQKILAGVNASRERGSKFGVSATPTFFFNGKKEEGEQTLVNIDKLLAG